MIVFLYYQKAGLFFMLAALLMGFARIYVGVHWPTDIIVGAGLGILVGYSVYYVAGLWKQKGAS
jgi:undecaprenyl-diphosphatase